MQNHFLSKIGQCVFISLIILLLMPIDWLSAPLALLLGLVFAVFFGNPYKKTLNKIIKHLLQISIIGIGFGISASSALTLGKSSLLFVFIFILSTMIIGLILGIILKTDKKTSHLITTGTSICGGSAIAAIFPIIKADGKQVSAAFGTVFTLSAIALFIFPLIGDLLNLTQKQFGFWSALAIHDTGSVLGAASYYGEESLEVATTIKLSRILFIIPLILIEGLMFKKRGSKSAFPYFIILFLLAIFINSSLPEYKEFFTSIKIISKRGLIVTLFLIGANLSLNQLKNIGFKPFLQGSLLWIIISVTSLLFVIYTI